MPLATLPAVDVHLKLKICIVEDNDDLRASLAFAGVGALCVALAAWRHPLLRGVRALPVTLTPATALPASASRSLPRRSWRALSK